MNSAEPNMETKMNPKESQAHSQRFETGYAPLAHRVVVRISGPGAAKFVQGQFSQNVDEVIADQSLRAAACTPKGRAYCLTRLVRHQDDLLLDLDAALADATLTHLRKYLMLFRGTSMELMPDAGIVGLIGQAAAIAVWGEAASSLSRPGQTLVSDSGILIRVEDACGQIPRYEWWQLDSQQSMPAELTELSPDTWEASSIAAGVPWLTPETQEVYVPQMLNLQHLQGIHFKKGCYTGQEVIARMHFLGQLKKSLFRLSFQGSNTAPAPGTRLMSGDKSVGEVVNAAITGDQTGELLAVIRHDAQQEALTLDGAEAVTLQMEDLPYPVPEHQPATQADT